MKIDLPNDLRGFAFDRVLPVELNDFSVDLLLPSLFFKAITQGSERGRRPNDPEKIDDYVNALASHVLVDGFDDRDGRRALDRLTRTSLVKISAVGQSHRGEKIDGVSGHTLLTFKTGFPTEVSRMRRVDAFIYRMLREQMRGDEHLHRFLVQVFGRGLTLRGGAEPDGTWDGTTALDTLTRLSIAFLDGMATTGIGRTKNKSAYDAIPAVGEAMARDLRRYLEAYHTRMPLEGLTYYLKAIISFELFIYTLKLISSVVDLVANPAELPPAMQKPRRPSPPELYLDFTTTGAGLSRQMATTCVRRDIELIGRFIQANLTLKHLDRYATQLRKNPRVRKTVEDALASDSDDSQYLQSLLLLLDNQTVSMHIDAAAQLDEERIRDQYRLSANGDDDGPSLLELDNIAATGESSFDRIVLLITEGIRRKTSQSITRWYWSVGGLVEPHGILSGSLQQRQSWRYAPSNDLLAAFVQLAAVDIPRWDHHDPAPQPIKLQDFLEWLTDRFGILVDRPPSEFTGAEYVAAAQDNLRAMLRRLQQMGIFRDLSDDFTVQRLTPPYAKQQEVGSL